MDSLESFEVDAMVRGYHVYKDIWVAHVGEVLPCCRETSNRHNPFAVSVKKNGTIVGHVPRKISTLCSLFLRKGGSIYCCVTGVRRYSWDLVQGGLEIPCTLLFQPNGNMTRQQMEKSKKLLLSVLAHCETPPHRKIKIDNDNNDTGNDKDIWVRTGTIDLFNVDKESIMKGEQLNDEVINTAQLIIKKQFPTLVGLQSTQLQNSISMLKQLSSASHTLKRKSLDFSCNNNNIG